MKKRQLLIIVISLLCTQRSFAGVSDSLNVTDIIERSLQREEYYNTYAKLPSMLRFWDKGDFALISSGYSSSKGDYTHPQLLFSRNLLEIKTESVKTLSKKGLRFFGSVAYTNGNASTGEWNLSYYLPSNGSPFYYMVEQEGTWKTQSYDFNVAIQKSLSNRLSAGVAFKYLGDLNFRTFDTRNESYTLDMQILPSITMSFGEKSFATMGLFFNRVKNESAIRNKYQHGTEPERYHLFLNQGLGTWDNSPSQMRTIDARYGAVASFRYLKGSKIMDFIYSIYIADEDWLLKSVSTLQERKENIARYSYFCQDFAVRYRENRESGSWISNLDIKNILGTGAVYKETVGLFQDNYELFKIKANLYLAYLRERSLLRRVSANINFDNTGQNDFNYGHTIDYNNLEGTLSADLSLGSIERLNFIIGGYGSYKMNISGKHNPMAASGNFYNTQIAMPAFAYHTSNFYRVGLVLGTEFNLRESQRVEVNLKGDFIKPVSISNYESSASFTLEDNYMNISVNLVFNF
jgi:hypothetical protein